MSKALFLSDNEALTLTGILAACMDKVDTAQPGKEGYTINEVSEIRRMHRALVFINKEGTKNEQEKKQN
jgi:hypothetical protein